jgi:hypothetical protein
MQPLADGQSIGVIQIWEVLLGIDYFLKKMRG